MSNTILLFLNAIIIMAVTSLGLLAWVRNRNKKTNLFFLIITICVALWLLCNYLVDFTPTIADPVLWTKLTNIFGLWSVYFLLCFSLFFPVELAKSVKKYITFYLILPMVFTIFMFTNLVVESVKKIEGVQIPVSGSLMMVYTAYLVITAAIGLIVLYLKFRKSGGLQKNQIKFVLLGLGVSAIFALIFSSVIPIIINRAETARIAPLTTIFFLGFTYYAIARHRLMDIRLVVARSITYAVLLAFLALVYAGSVLGIERLFFQNALDQEGIYQIVLRTVLAVVIAFTFQPLRRWITKVTDKIFFKNAYDPQKLLDELSHTMGSTIVLIELLYRVTDILIQEMKVSRGLFVLLKDESEVYTIQANGYRQNPEINIDDIIHLAKDGTVVYDELAESSRYKSILRKYEAAVSLPLKTEKEIVGVFLVGEKNSGDMFNQQDLRILEIVAPEVSVAIENAKSYEEISRFNVTLRNEVKRATHRLKEKNQQLRELDKAKDEFISMASHQLRTPLTAIKGYLSMLLDGDAGEIKVGQYDFINEAYSGANRMVGLINDLLNVSRMETGRFFLEPEDLDIEQIIKEEVQQLVNVAKEKGLYLKIDKKNDVPKVWADETKIRQVIMNFIDNAIHYTAKGGVTAKYGKEKGYFVFSVKDTGIGVPKEQQKKLFEKFFRADNARHSRPDGTGLGLFLAKRVVEDHNGSIFFSSIEGQGSVFGFRLPLKKSELIKPSVLETKPTTVTTEKKEPTADKLAEPNPEDLLTEQQQVPIPVDEPEHVLRK